MSNSILEILQQGKSASFTMSTLETEQKNVVLQSFAHLLKQNIDLLLDANEKDLNEQKDKISPALYQRLGLNQKKIEQLIGGIQDLINLPDPANVTVWKRKIAAGPELERRTVPIGVLAIIFESRPDVIPQILSLVLKSGNAAILKGGSEAIHSNRAFMQLIDQLTQQHSYLPTNWAQLIETRQEVSELLSYPQYVDLVIPRGSNQLVSSIMQATSIPVLGHADGVCHIYLHPSAKIENAASIIINAKTQYPAACNAVETLLIDKSTPLATVKTLVQELIKAEITLQGDPWIRDIFPDLEEATDWHTEYGDQTMAIKGVASLEDAIAHINKHGSHHTDAILAEEKTIIEEFLSGVDSANVFANASTRFADGIRFGMGAEVAISTAKTHSRGPVGLDGLVIYKYRLIGNGEIVS